MAALLLKLPCVCWEWVCTCAGLSWIEKMPLALVRRGFFFNQILRLVVVRFYSELECKNCYSYCGTLNSGLKKDKKKSYF